MKNRKGLYPIDRVGSIKAIKLITTPVDGRYKYEFGSTRVVFDNRWLIVVKSPVVTDVGGVPTLTLDWMFAPKAQPKPV